VYCYSVPSTWFLFCCSISLHVFFNYLCWIYFFNIELVENWALAFLICFLFSFFLFFFQNCLFFFSELFLLILFFYYWAGWEFSFLVFFLWNTVDCYSVSLHRFFNDFFVFFNYLYRFYFFYIELLEILTL
jgi:hypothetical protein